MHLAVIGGSANIILATLNQKVQLLRRALFLSLPLDTAFRMLSIVCSLFRVPGQICVQKAGAQVSQPNHTVKQGKHQCIPRLQHRNPSLQHWMFHEFRVLLGLQRVPKLCDRYVHLLLGVWFENQGQ
jgi:hypothetical protein